jgi:hypothetical protein
LENENPGISPLLFVLTGAAYLSIFTSLRDFCLPLYHQTILSYW